MSPDFEADVRRREKIAAAYAQVFESPQGRIVFNDLCETAMFLSPMLEPCDPHGTAWNDGRRAMVLTIMDRLRWTPADLLRLALARQDRDFDPIPPDYGSTRIEDDAQTVIGGF